MYGLFCVNHHLAQRRVSSKFVAKLAIAPTISATPKFRCVNGIELTCQQECIYRIQRFQKSVRANPVAQLQEIAHIKGLRSVYGYVQYMSMRNFSSISEAVLAKLKVASIYSLLFNSIPAMPNRISKAWVRHRIEEVIGQLSTMLNDEQIEDIVQAFTRKGLT